MDNREETAMSSSRGKTAFDWDLYDSRVKVLRRFRETNEYVDGVLETDDGVVFPVHLVVVSGLGDQITRFMYEQIECDSDAFTEIETANGKSRVKRIKFPQVKADTLKTLIDCAYTGELRTDVSRVWDVMRVAEQFAMTEVVNTCCSYLCRHVDTSNCVEMYRIGKSKRHKHLIEASLFGMRREIETIVRKGPFFQTINVKDLKAMLCSDDLGTSSEEFVWEAIKTWIMADYEARRGSVDYLLTTLRFHRTKNSFLRSLMSDPLIKSGKRKGRSGADVERMWNQKTASKYPMDAWGLAVGLEPESVRPRIPNGILFGMGGWNGGRTTNLIETYDRTTNMWFELKNHLNTGPPHAYYGHEWHKGRIFMFGGTDGRNIKSTVISFDPVTREWKSHAGMSSRRCYVATAVLNGIVYAIGGHNGDHRLRTVEKYDAEKDEWTAVADMNVARSDAGCAILDGKIYAVGGLNENSIEASMEYYDPVVDKWTMSQEMSSPRTSLAVVTVKGLIFALGGNRGDNRLSSCEKFDPLTSTWTPIKRMIDKRSTFSACVVEDKIIVVGGYDGQQPFGRCESYDPVTDTWTAISSLNNDRSGLALVKVTGIRNGADYTFCGNQKTSLLR